MPASIVQAFEAVAARAPSSAALAWRDTRWTYGELSRAAAGVREGLLSRGLPRGARIALLLRNSPHYVACYYGILGAGCVAVPLNALERAGVLLRQIEHCGASLVIGDATNPEWPAVNAALGLSSVQRLAITLAESAEGLGQLARETPGTAAPVAGVAPGPGIAPAPGELAAIIYTSGTTGRPKGVMLSHENLYSNAVAIGRYLGLGPSDCGLCVLPLHFSYGNSVLHSHLLCGARLVLDDNLAYPHLLLQHIAQEAVTGFAGVPATFALLLARCRLQDFDLRSLRYVTQAGGAMPGALVEKLREQLPGVGIFLMYGQTEATARLTYLPPAQLTARRGSVGIPIDGVEIDIRHQDRSLPRGTMGEICARGPNVMLGYWNDRAATAEVLREGWLHTGDLGRLDEDGYLFIQGRASDMIKVGAYRVSPQEIEEAVASLPGVAEVAAAAAADEMLGQAVKVVIVPAPGAALDARAVKAHCRERLAAYKVPKIVEFADTLPRTSSGKVQRFKLV